MKRLVNWLGDNILYLCTLALLVFIPLYPKLPLFDIKNTWVYIRVEDFLVIFVFAIWLFMLFKQKITFKTPLTLPILIFWIIGLISTMHGIILIFPQVANVFSNVAFFTFIRHIEYMSLFFIAYAGMKDRKLLPGIIIAISVTFLLVSLYGIGQKYLGFPAYLTMNEEFAKGAPITLSQLSRVPSTFAGHYDLAAYLVMMIPILASLLLGVRNWLLKIFFGISVLLGVVVLAMTVSRVSFFVLFVALFIVLYFKSRRLVAIAIPIVILVGLVFLSYQPAIFSRFGNTVKEVNVLVDAGTGNAIGHVSYVSSEEFENKAINQRRIGEGGRIYTAPIEEDENARASPSSLLLLQKLPEEVPVISDVNLSTGENLPQGTGYINLSLSPVEKKLNYFFYQKTDEASQVFQVFIFHGNFLVKKASAYDLSFTTRFQGEWPNALEAFQRNILLGSGYGSVSLAVDNNYLRMLGETGVLGLVSFFGIFAVLGIYVKKVFKNIESPLAKSFITGAVAGFVGLCLNAVLIDVFEASKIAFILWILAGVIMGTLVLYQKGEIDTVGELKKILLSPIAVAIFIITFASFIFLPMVNNFFVGDDFTWLRWATDCSGLGNSGSCLSLNTIIKYFTEAGGFFYRPGAKTYFLLMHSIFWLNQVAYHAVSIILHFSIIITFFILAKKIFRSFNLSVLASILFLIISGYAEAVFWISSTGHLFTAFFALLSLLFFILGEEKKNNIFFVFSLIISFISSLFHELGIVIPLLLLSYKVILGEKLSLDKLLKQVHYLLLFLPTVAYLLIRLSAHSHWFSGDYSYNLLKLPFNALGNIFGYTLLIIAGPMSLPIYQISRSVMRENIGLSLLFVTIFSVIVVILGTLIIRITDSRERKIILFGFSFFIVSLIPFLGLGNITSRYSYLASIGVVLILVVLFRKLFTYFIGQGKNIGYCLIAILVGVFSLWHIIQIQQTNFDWSGAGMKTQKFLTSIEGLYQEAWSSEPVELHFVDVPTKYGEAWVFPVGIEDAVWLVFHNNNIKIFKHSSIEEAFNNGAGTTPLNPVFVFQEDGSLKEEYLPKPQIVN